MNTPPLDVSPLPFIIGAGLVLALVAGIITLLVILIVHLVKRSRRNRAGGGQE